MRDGAKQGDMDVKFGLSKEAVDALSGELGIILANTHLLYVKTLNYHWNLEDPRFISLHQLFEKQYEELAEFGDLIAERIRTMGRKAPGSLAAFLALGTLEEAKSSPSGDEMVADLAASHEALFPELRRVIEKATELEDIGTADLLTDALRAHEKSAWFLRSHL
jgi:starvation-inducible DNA-binding protein